MNQYVTVIKGEEEIADQVLLANTVFKRMLGLMPVKVLGKNKGLLLSPCGQIHTYHMKFAIDVVFLSKGSVILHIEHHLVPNKMTQYFRYADKILELNSGACVEHGLAVGDRLTIQPYDKEQ